MKKLPSVLAVAALAAVLAPSMSHAQAGSPFDHLKCYKIKDPAGKILYKADLNPLQKPPFTVEPGCIISVPAKLFCIPVQKSNVHPVAPVSANGQQTQDYLLYKIKCPQVGAVTKGGIPVNIVDQFGLRTIKVIKNQVLLVPAFKTTHLCHAQTDPAAPLCAGDCQNANEKCVQIPGTNMCDCEAPCAFDGTAAQCGGMCPFPGQQCRFVTTTGGVTQCTCDPFVDQCSFDGQGQCAGPCPDATRKCVADPATGSCNCEKPCGSTGIHQCGGLCPNPADACLTKPDDSGCECRTTTTPCGPDAATGQCAGDCPNGLPCVRGGPVAGGCICG